MAGVTAHGATFSFSTFSGKLTGISVEMPTAEVTNMTAAEDNLGYTFMVPTGEQSGGTITVDFITTNADPWTFVKKVDILRFSSEGYTVSRRVICESASVSAQSGELVRGSLRFLITDYQGT
jgi:flagella basal body P-ring formation protein FlgA